MVGGRNMESASRSRRDGAWGREIVVGYRSVIRLAFDAAHDIPRSIHRRTRGNCPDHQRQRPRHANADPVRNIFRYRFVPVAVIR